MKFLVIEEKRMDWKKIRRAINLTGRTNYSLKTVRGKIQVFFPNKDLDRIDVDKISMYLKMDVISISDVRAVIRY